MQSMRWDTFLDPRPVGIPRTTLEIILNIPIAPSVNRLHIRVGRGRVVRSAQYNEWESAAKSWILCTRQYPRERITGPFEVEILLSEQYRGDGDNRIKATLDLLQKIEIIKNDKDCRRGRWEWVLADQAPVGCRVHLRSLHQ